MVAFPDRTQRLVVTKASRQGEEDWRVVIQASPVSPPSPKALAFAIARGALRVLASQGHPLERGIFDEEGRNITGAVYRS